MCKKLIFLISFALMLGMAANVSAGLIAHWEFDEGSGTIARDSSGKGHDGTLQGDPQWVTGMIGSGALSFDSTDGLVEVGDDASLSLTDALTITAWVSVHDLNTYYFILCKQPSGTAGDNYPGNYEFRTEANSGALQFGHQETEGEQYSFYTSDSSIAVEQWHHVAVTVTKGDLVEFYIDGVAAGSSEQSTNFGVLNDEPVRIGGRKDGYSFFNGLLDDIRLYDRTLSATQIQKLFEGIPPMFTIAEKPDPEDGALYEDTWVNLSWSPGDFAVSHDVYLGDNFDEVNDGTGDTFRGNQTGTFLVAGFPGFPYPDGLVPGTTYYWRIDEVNDSEPNSPWKGDVWSFSIPPKTGYNPDPADGAEFVDPNAILTWTPGFGARIHTVYFGDNFDDVDNATGGTPTGTASYSPAALESEKVYYWRVDEFDALETYKGDIWAFTTPGAVGNPQPANGAVDVQMIETLSWTAADNAASHELYFGTDTDAVKNATIASPEYIGPRALGAESYDPGGLAWDGSYAWRVDEVYPTGTVKGLVWTLTTADFILVDDFESYDDIDPLPGEPGINRIFDKWLDGFGTTTNGALVGNDLPPYAEQTIVHGGAQSMPYRYDNNLKTSEATLTLVYPRDWTEQGVTKLSLWFRGGSANSAERMFVALNGTAVVYHNDPAVTQMTGWNRWVIDLQEFVGVNLTNVNTVTIGFGTKGSPAAGGTGQMYFDDIRLKR
jgi:hypothetical protein